MTYTGDTNPPTPDEIIADSTYAVTGDGVEQITVYDGFDDMEWTNGEASVLLPAGVSYCTVHAGILNDDDRTCDFADDDEECKPHACYYIIATEMGAGDE